ncbi:leucine-rich repeat-containing protein 19 [Anomaloglossus baeobatrachus]|uniref:leucine-rich repeat-containing protein 19 n=1 Tax=Anomaloglossus baeobatrachus TaxID=238106 RepID=UPI003F4FB613
MKTVILLICMGSLYNHIQCQDPTEENWSGKNLTNVPKSNSTKTRKLNLSQNEISLSPTDQQSLATYPDLTELDLSQNAITKLENKHFTALSKLEVLILKNNHISFVGEMSLDGLKNLRILDLGFNSITQLPTNIQMPSTYLQTFNLQNNRLSTLDIKEALKDLNSSLKLTLSGNSWNCTCSLINLSLWLDSSTVILENENITLCAAPENMINYTVTAVNKAEGTLLNCSSSRNVSSSIAPIPSFDNSSSPVTPSVNATNNTSAKGNSWTFLVGVIVVGLVTSLLILLAVKFPRWYDFILSYNHQRLKEEDPYMFEEEFNVDFSMGNNERHQDDENVVVFEQMHSFVPEEDGFIEDKYIDERDITDS